MVASKPVIYRDTSYMLAHMNFTINLSEDCFFYSLEYLLNNLKRID